MSNGRLFVKRDSSIQFIDVTIPTFEVADDLVLYNVRIRLDGSSWGVSHRFSNFHKLHKSLERLLPGQNLPPFPGKHRIRTLARVSKNEEFLAKRKGELEDYLNSIVTIPAVQQLEIVKAFLSLDNTAQQALSQKAKRNSILGGAVFGVPLHSFGALNMDVPHVVEQCCFYISENGLEEPELFGGHTAEAIQRVRAVYNTGADVDFSEYENGAQVAAGTLVAFLQEAPEAVVPEYLYGEFVAVTDIPKGDIMTRAQSLKEAQKKLPPIHRATLLSILTLIALIMESNNNIGVDQMVRLFTPLFFRPKSEEGQAKAAEVMKLMLERKRAVFRASAVLE